MKRILLAAAALVAFSSAAFAQGPAGQSFDLVSGETVSAVTFSDDGVFTHTAGDVTAEGAYTYADGELCVTMTGGDAEAEPVCGAWTDLEIGESVVTIEFSADGSEMTITRTA
ncbi:MAG: hypothetical protein RIA71_08315 [Oceanicaulis sp.]